MMAGNKFSFHSFLGPSPQLFPLSFPSPKKWSVGRTNQHNKWVYGDQRVYVEYNYPKAKEKKKAKTAPP
jgi:hypothetical protein